MQAGDAILKTLGVVVLVSRAVCLVRQMKASFDFIQSWCVGAQWPGWIICKPRVPAYQHNVLCSPGGKNCCALSVRL